MIQTLLRTIAPAALLAAAAALIGPDFLESAPAGEPLLVAGPSQMRAESVALKGPYCGSAGERQNLLLMLDGGDAVVVPLAPAHNPGCRRVTKKPSGV